MKPGKADYTCWRTCKNRESSQKESFPYLHTEEKKNSQKTGVPERAISINGSPGLGKGSEGLKRSHSSLRSSYTFKNHTVHTEKGGKKERIDGTG